MNVAYKSFEARLARWDDVFQQVAAFAGTLPRQRIIAISHAAGGAKSAIVWYWVSGSGVPAMPVEYRIFRGSLASWDDLFRQASDFVDSLSRDRVLTISHSWDNLEGVVTVWFWKPDKCLSCGAEFPVEDNTCPACGWTFASQDEE